MSHGVIQQLKSMFARHGIPEQVISDNGPQSPPERLTYLTSSQNFRQSHGEAERAVQTVKHLLENAKDPSLSSHAGIQNNTIITEWL